MIDEAEFTRRPTVIGGRRLEEDWLISYRGGRPLARVHHYTTGSSKFWQWMTCTYPSRHGRAASLEDALMAVKDAVLELPEDQRCRHP